MIQPIAFGVLAPSKQIQVEKIFLQPIQLHSSMVDSEGGHLGHTTFQVATGILLHAIIRTKEHL